MSNTEQFNQEVLDIIEDAQTRYRQGENIELKEKIPLTSDIPLESNTWWRVNDVICVFIDMKDSTKLSAHKQDKDTAGIYQYFTGSAVKILNYFGASYIDVRGDGAFGLYNSKMIYHALASAITFKTLTAQFIGEDIKLPVDLGKISCHIGIDKKTVLVKRIGMRTLESKTDKENEVWAGKPVNMAAKLSSLGEENDVIVSERVFGRFLADSSYHVLKTCGCPDGKAKKAWDTIELTNDSKFDFSKAYKLVTSGWCSTHGKDYCKNILELDNN